MQGHHVQAVPDGQTGVALAPTSQPDAVLIDIGLPGVDGYEVARSLRATSAGQHMVLVALTGYGQADDRRRTREAGFDHHLVEPIDAEDLMRALGSRVPRLEPAPDGRERRP
jgi:CheY-like chemotaxis protein